MEEKDIKTIDVWVSINQNGFVNVSLDQPIRNEQLAKWSYKYPFVNSYVYKDIKNIVEHTKLNWQNDAEFFTVQC